MRLLLHGPRGKRGTGECVFFVVHPLTQMIMAASWGGWDGSSSCVSLRLLSEEFPVLCARAVRTWNLVHYFRVPVSGTPCSGRLGVAHEYENWILREMTVFVGSGYMFCVSTLVARRISHIFYVAADSNPEVLLSLLLQNGEGCPVDASGCSFDQFSLLLQNGEGCPVDASGCSFAQRGSHLENWKYFYDFPVAAMRVCVRHRCRGAGSTRE